MTRPYQHHTLEQLHALRSDPRVGDVQRARIAEELALREEAAGVKANPVRELVREKDVQRRIYRELTRIGCTIYWMSQARKTGQTPGVPDLIVFHPDRGLAFIEVKAPGGKIRREQAVFRTHCAAAGVTYLLGGLDVVADHYGFEEDDAA